MEPICERPQQSNIRMVQARTTGGSAHSGKSMVGHGAAYARGSRWAKVTRPMSARYVHLEEMGWKAERQDMEGYLTRI